MLFAVVPLAGLRAFGEKSWDPALEPYVAFVEAERGLEFSEPVDVRWADISAELEAERPATPANSEQVDPWTEAYRLLGLVDPNPDVTLDQELNDTLSENAGAFYEPWSETIVLPEGSSDIELSVTIVHELTHALQHQNGMLGGSGIFETDDDMAARTTLIEGDAERIALAWYWAQPEAFQNDYLDAIGYDPDATFDDPGDSFFATSFYASYEIGTPLVESIVATQGVEKVNELLRAKNLGTTDRLVDVLGDQQFSTFDAIEDMTVPESSDGAVGDLGALTWFQALAPIVGTEAAFDALIGYDDDAFAIVDVSGRTCARFSIFFETESEGAEFIGVLDEASVKGDHSLVNNEAMLDLCEPIGNPADQRFGTIMPLIVAHEAAVAHLANGETVEVARCAAIAQASTIPADQSLDDFVGWETVTGQIAEFLPGCK